MTTVNRPQAVGLTLLTVLGLITGLTACGAPAFQAVDDGRATSWAEPDPSRPVLDLEFRAGDDLTAVSGTERVVFTPDLPVCELVFRAWPNGPFAAEAGTSLTVTSASIDGSAVSPVVSAAGAPESAPGTLISLPLPECVDAGHPVTAELTFDLKLGYNADDRFGAASEGDLAWFGSAYPMLAWERGIGWARDSAVRVTGETSTSETFELESLRVVAPSRFEVLGVGTAAAPEIDPATGTTLHEFSAPALRDVTVTVGELRTAQAVSESGTVIHVGGPTDRLRSAPAAWATAVAAAVDRVSDYLGPVPYDDIWVSLIPEQSEGIEYPGAIQFGRFSLRDERWLVTHEVAHMWFFGLVGNNQARDPWLDESFATFVQRVVDDPDHDPAVTHGPEDPAHPDVGLSMAEWATFDRPSLTYVSAVYTGGANMLIEARAAAGAAAFDRDLRRYLADNAHTIATPDDVATAFADLPEAIERMRAAGAITS